MWSSGRCAVKAILLSRHDTFPFQTFNNVTDHTIAAVIAAYCKKLPDDLTAGLLLQYCRLDTADALAEIEAAAFIIDVCTVEIEDRHALLLRLVMTLSQQTHATPIE